MRRTVILSTAVALALISAACSKKDDVKVTPTSTIAAPARTSTTTLADAPGASNDAFIEKADAACTADHEAKNKIGMPANNDEVIGYLKRVLPIEEAAAQQLGDLGDPPADATVWNEAIGTQKQVLDRVRSLLHDPSYTGDDIVADTKIKDWQAKANAAFIKFGLKVCGKP